MSIRQRGKYWIVDVGESGRRVRQSARTAKEARRKEADLRRALSRRAPSGGLEAAIVRYRETKISGLRDQVGAEIKCKYLLPFVQGKTFDDIPEIADNIKKTLSGLGYLPSTINHRLKLLRRLSNLAFEEWLWIDRPVGKQIKLLPERNARHVYLSREQVESLAIRCRPAVGDFIRLAAYTGARRGELFRLDKGSVRGNAVWLDPHNKTGKPRLIPVPARIVPILQKIPLLITRQTVRDDWEAAREAAGLSHVHFHDLRHTYASWLAQAGISLRVIGELLGHTQTQTTQRYAHLCTDTLEQAVSVLG